MGESSAGTLRRGVRTGVFAAECVVAAGLIVWNMIDDSSGGYVLVAGAAISVLATLRPIRRAIVNRWRRAGFAIRRARRKPHEATAPAFDVPLPGASSADGARAPTAQMGARWVDDTLITMLALHPPGTVASTLTPAGVADAEPGTTVTPALIANCLNTFDITVDSVDLISHGQRMTGPGPIATVYHHTLGPVPAVANRATFLVIRLRPADCTDAITRRGGGSLGALRAAVITTRRIAAALTDAGLAVTILDARQITDATSFLADGAPIGDVTEDWSAVSHGPTRIRTFAVASDRLSQVVAASGWSHAALSTTLAIRIRPTPAAPVGAALLRVTEHPASNRVLAEQITGTRPLPGRQFEALCATLPVGIPPHLHRHLQWAPLPPACDLPIGGCGQLLGADAAGRALTLPLVSGTAVIVTGRQPWVWQLVIRAIATGARARISTDRPDYWQPLIAIVGDADALSMHGPSARGTPPPTLHILDESRSTTTSSASADLPPDTARLCIVDTPPAPDAATADTIRLMQDHATSGCVDVAMAGRVRSVSIVATAQERRLLGIIGDAARGHASAGAPPRATVPRPEPVPERTSPLMLRPAR